MSGFIKQIGSFFSYKEPKNEELGFELLEDENEDVAQDQQRNVDQQEKSHQQIKTGQQGDQQHKKNKASKQPIKIEEWNESRKTESTVSADTCQPQSNSNDISFVLCQNLATIKEKFHIPQNQDIIIREFKIGRKMKAFMVYLQGMMDKNSIDLAILPKLMDKDIFDDLDEDYPIDYLIDNILSVHSVKKLPICFIVSI